MMFVDVCMKDAEELREIAAHFDLLGKKSNGEFLREVASRHEILAGAYRSSVTRYERELKEWIERVEDMRDTARAPRPENSNSRSCNRRLAVDELIERLRSVKWEVIDDDDWDSRCVFVDMRPDDFEALLNEAAAALEAAREDAERYRHIRRKESSGGSADLCIFRVRWAKSGVKTPEPDYDLLVECEDDVAIDQARGKEGP